MEVIKKDRSVVSVSVKENLRQVFSLSKSYPERLHIFVTNFTFCNAVSVCKFSCRYYDPFLVMLLFYSPFTIYIAQSWTTPGRPRPHYAYSHKVLRRNREKWDFEFSDNECEKERIAKGSVIGVRYVERDKHCISDYSGQVCQEFTKQCGFLVIHKDFFFLHCFASQLCSNVLNTQQPNHPFLLSNQCLQMVIHT